MPSDHTHPDQDEKLKAMGLVSRMKRKCEDSPERPAKQVYNEVLREMNDLGDADRVAQHFPQFHQVKSSLCRQRRKSLPPLPQTLDEINIAPPYTDTRDGRRFLLASDGDAQETILVFATDESIERLCAARQVYMDGTFWASPRLFHQLYSIHVMELNVSVPVVFALLPTKSRNTYVRLFRIIKDAATHLQLNFSPDCVSMDFEMACIQGFRTEFPNAHISGCMFHFCQCIWRKTQELGLTEDYRENPDIRKFIRRLAAMYFVPLDSMDDAWLMLAAEAPMDPRIMQLADYFVRTWYDDINPTFSRRMWNHYNNMNLDSIRTNNALEGFHS